MTSHTKDTLRKLALRKYKDPTAPADVKQMATGLLMLLDGRLP